MYYNIFKAITLHYSLLQHITAYIIVLQSNIVYNACQCISVENNALWFMKVHCIILQCITDVDSVL